MREPKQIIHGE